MLADHLEAARIGRSCLRPVNSDASITQQQEEGTAQQGPDEGLPVKAEDSKLIWRDVKGKITALSWHPLLAHHMAFGCDNGQVTMMRLAEGGERALNFTVRHPAPVTSCCWLLPGLGSGVDPQGASGSTLLTLCASGVALLWRIDPSTAFEPLANPLATRDGPSLSSSLHSWRPLSISQAMAGAWTKLTAMATAAECRALAIAVDNGSLMAFAGATLPPFSGETLQPLDMFYEGQEPANKRGVVHVRAVVKVMAFSSMQAHLIRLAVGHEDGRITWWCWRIRFPQPSKIGRRGACKRHMLRLHGKLQLPAKNVSALAWHPAPAVPELACAIADCSIQICRIVDDAMVIHHELIPGAAAHTRVESSEGISLRPQRPSAAQGPAAPDASGSSPSIAHPSIEIPEAPGPSRADVSPQAEPQQSPVPSPPGLSPGPSPGKKYQKRGVGGVNGRMMLLPWLNEDKWPFTQAAQQSCQHACVRLAHQLRIAESAAESSSAPADFDCRLVTDLGLAVDPLQATYVLQDLVDEVVAGGEAGSYISAPTRRLLAHRQAALHMWRGDIISALSILGHHSALTADFVALAAPAGPITWASAAKVYSIKLEGQDDMHLAALYLLATGDAEEAVSVYIRANMPREAAVLGCARLLSGHPLISQACEAFAALLQSDGHYEHAAAVLLIGSGNPRAQLRYTPAELRTIGDSTPASSLDLRPPEVKVGDGPAPTSLEASGGEDGWGQLQGRGGTGPQYGGGTGPQYVRGGRGRGWRGRGGRFQY
ncbi:hypothetical protein WJX73_008764 [Symbiochloris irregularis]|uniref:Gem-associated protein 5 TPR domain-containing protein n=1 Tax=Symbiochloris irregularis TaxID=706552 RepID=A0AAW1NR67_9CHLO